MSTSVKNFSILLVSIALLLPFSAHAATTCDNTGKLTDENGIVVGTCDPVGNSNASDSFAFKRQGVFGCSLNGSYSMSVGALSAVGGVYVPVNDAAVTLNTGYLVYKECILRGIVDRQRENATSAFEKQGLSAFLTGRDGKPLFPQNLRQEYLDRSDAAFVQYVESNQLQALNPAFQGPVKRALARGYSTATRYRSQSFACPYTALDAQITGKAFSFQGLIASGNPACDPVFAYLLAEEDYQNYVNADRLEMDTRLGWANGVYDVQTLDAQGNRITQTPGTIVGSNIAQLLQTGYRQLENANDIDQMVGALFAGITSHVVGDNKGLAGLLTPVGGKPSYLDQVAAESSQGLRDSAVNAALQILSAAKQVEVGYKQLMDGIAGLLSNSVNELRSKETACFALIIQKVCTGTPAANGTCTAVQSCTTDPVTHEQTCPTAVTLQIATSTTFSQAVVNNRIVPLASTTVQNQQRANESLTTIDRLIAGVTNTSSLDAQRVALQQLDNLVSQRALHTQYDLQAAQKSRDDVEASMSTLLTDTVKAWTENPDPNVGWCNINNGAVLDMWKTRWKK